MAFSRQVTGSIFGSKPLFGSSQPSNTTPSLFGQTTQQQPSSTGGIFGQQSQQQQQPAQTGSLFGSTTGTQQQPQAGSLFGSTTGTQQQPQAGSLFGSTPGTQQQPQAGSLFGSTTGTQQQPQAGSLFGNTSTQQQPQPGSLFGSTPGTQQQPQAGSLFGGTAGTQQPQAGGLFGSTTSAQHQPQAGSLFGGFGTSTQSQQQPQTTGSVFGNGSIFGSRPQQPQLQPSAPVGLNVVLTKTTKFNDLPEDMRRELESLDSFIQSQIQISKDLHQRKLGEEPLKGYELIKGANKDFVNCNTNIRHDLHFMRDLKAKVDRAVEDTIIATRIVDGSKNPQSSGGGGYLKEHANFPFEFFWRVTDQIAARLSWYKTTIEQIERKLTSTSQAQTPHSIAAALQAQHQTFLALASKTAALDAELKKIKSLYTQLWRQKTGSMRDPFDELDKGAAVDLGLEALNVK
ncbi:hypothetical protein AX14_003199 [Amanita brunnescens Koide BX004]|nr:hypothetical protein AX14_003199 [Amanita brunnescens Koide BX004]